MELLKKISFFVFTIFIFVLFAWALFIPKEEITKKITEAAKKQNTISDLSFRGVTVQEVVEGIKYWEIKAKTSELNQGSNLAILREAEGTFFEKGSPTLKFISPEIVWKIDKKEIEIKSPFGFDPGSEAKVRSILKDPQKNIFFLPAANGKGSYFRAEKLDWKLKDKKISCDGNIWIKRGKIIGKAENLKSDVTLSKVLLGGNPFIMTSSDNPATIEAMFFEVDNKNDLIVARGDVTITSNDRKATGELGTYHIKKDTISLSGNTRLEEKGNSLTGEKIVYLVKKNSFTISGKSRAVISEEKLKEGEQ
ncbi:hypothetical protein A2276_06395 [candidate division WOR-1 bacterium RIFOXYA12_FULL_43_27]|uniref:Organic solvent tolerance-like N-terminal domain-containing protein n=1 Tax=candidate division WOR-1 bacterium RIFOXYC2_FULL_46_14 TaxID=1802587 RepID=A0A1F4U5H6_UNCSA|nr:MAG: hypothetical protein A2276_06395 [candidate division WOR-1 bacterium RIFOXYA12_FULL_43_27]OGC20281.1 MAG: hypothetical protein A2292_04395 [candidate division WOR-1 bacterium RIFOXYB2_FULL_46_45]OGC31982.1 MAG: hypothetical protein A2232_07055 [candidate division WOR-1 bacterium RIFOXYA2_FULL_46_56]OGC40127.1 MAG: hypothetical protein A2438_02415 [candidate division WOR-1 bacterium RIFOXYC2_FULL_46_14]